MYFDFWTGVQMCGGPLLMFPLLLTVRTLVLTPGTVVVEVVVEICSQEFGNFIICLTLVGTGYKGVVT